MWIMMKYMHKFKTDLNHQIKGSWTDVVEEKSVEVSASEACYMCKEAFTMLEGKLEMQYEKICDFIEESRWSNPG